MSFQMSYRHYSLNITVDPGIYTNEGKEGGGGPEYMPPNYYNEPVVQQNPQESEWYVPQGAIPQGFELEENLGKEDTVQQQPVNFPQPPVWMNGVDENQPILYDWADYSKELNIFIKMDRPSVHSICLSNAKANCFPKRVGKVIY